MNDIVMIPAMGCDARLYARISEAIATRLRVRVIIVDADALGLCIQQVLEQAPAKFIILGTSFGGRVALETTLAAPGRVQGLVVIGAGAGVAADPAAGFRRAERLRGSEFENVVTEMADMVSHMPGPLGPAARQAFVDMAHDTGGAFMARQSDALAKRGDLRGMLSDILCPALMLWGREDKFSPASDGLRMSTMMRNARYSEITGCGHFPTLEAPEETANILLHWLQGMNFISD
jgi:pimeloyl-ACP methyl ester carboxylesterase